MQISDDFDAISFFFLHFQIAPLDLDDHAKTSKTKALIRDNSVEELQVFQKTIENRYCTQMWPKLYVGRGRE